jgi:hypothetical protein
MLEAFLIVFAVAFLSAFVFVWGVVLGWWF